MGDTRIEWAEKTWNPITGCTSISDGCKNCYAERMANRLRGRFGYPAIRPFQPGVFHEDRINDPLHWRKPRRIFVCSMGDFFHGMVARESQHRVYKIVEARPQHTFLFLTKRPENVLSWWMAETKNVWLGVTVESAKYLHRLAELKRIGAAVRYVSVEPMLGPVDLRPHLGWLDWVICGGETGPGARNVAARCILDLWRQCQDAGVPFFFKSWGGKERKNRTLFGREWNQLPK